MRPTQGKRWPRLALLVVAVSACAPAVDTGAVSPEDRAVLLETTGCGFASGRHGSGVAVADGVVVTAAHLVVQSDAIAVRVGESEPVPATLRHLDTTVDIAVLTTERSGLPTVLSWPGQAGDFGRIVGGAASGTVPYQIDRVVDLTIEEVLGTERHRRSGYDLVAATDSGDSGAGVYDEQNRLIGMVFAVSEEDGSTWVTASSEIEPVLEAAAEAGTTWACDPSRSRMVPS